jgi:hypothetical protein
MNPALGETIYVDFITSSPTTGAAADADSTPASEVFEDATDTAILTPSVTKRTGKTGNYRVQVACTTANGFEVGKSYNIVVSATVGTVAAKAVVQSFQIVADPWAKTMTELASVPAVNGTVLQALEWIFLLARNKITQTSTTQTLRNDADSGTIATSSVSDDGTTFIRNEFN